VRKCAERAAYYRAERGDAAREVSPPRGDDAAPWLEPFGREPTPPEAAVLSETVKQLLASLDVDERPVLELSLQGYTTREISEQLGRAERTIRLLRGGAGIGSSGCNVKACSLRPLWRELCQSGWETAVWTSRRSIMFSETNPGSSLLAKDWFALMDAVKRFELAWHQVPRPRIDDFLPNADPLRSRLLIELVHIDLELHLKAGATARVEEYLARYPQLTEDPAVALELIAAEYELRRHRQPGLALDEYLQRFPQYRADLPERIQRWTVADGETPLSPNQPYMEDMPEVAGYDVLGLLGRGGMGAVYKARQHSLDRLVALKFLPGQWARDPVWLARFRREARTASSLNHPHICTIYDTGEAGGRPFLSMELVEGRTLEALLGQRPPVEELARLVGQAARALAAAHAAGVVHRDIKPANLMVRNDGIVKVLDFGLARRLPASEVEHLAMSGFGTDPGTRVGTVLYMSPEQARAEPLDASTDIFSLGMVLYELATGQHPFRSDSSVGVLHAICEQAPVPPARLNPEIPAPLDALVLHMLAKDSRLRPTMLEVEAILNQLTVKMPERPGSQSVGIANRPTVGRKHELAALRIGFEEAAAGRGLVMCVTGEPGLGKTTLVESFLEELVSSGRHWSLARGRCSERLAGTEAYLPFLEALDSLLQGIGGVSAAQALKVLAPTWYVQLAPLAANDPSLARVLTEAKEASQERRKRELGLFLSGESRRRPLVIFLDDIHWADPSSVDLLAYLGSKCSGLRLLLILTYRASDLVRSQHPFGPVKLELQGRGVCREIALPFLSRDDLDNYLALAFAGHQFPEEFLAVLHARTEGNPLFMVDLLRYLRGRGVIVVDHGRWALVRAVPDLQRELPESVRGMIQRKVDQLSTADRHLLMAASVQGLEFDSAIVARVLSQESAEVEEQLVAVERVHAMVRPLREQMFPDGVLTVRYGFVHGLYQNALYDALQPTRKAAWSSAAARALLSHYGDKSASLAAELAILFEAARDYEHAADHYLVAVENAARSFAHHEVVALARRGLALLQTLPDTPERARRELPLQVTLGMQLQVVLGYAAPEAEHAYARALALCEREREAPLLFPVLRGLWAFCELRSELGKSLELAERLCALAQRAQDPAQLLQAHQTLVVTSFCLGNPIAAREHMEQGVALYDPKQHSSHTYIYGQDPGAACLSFGAVALWLLGYPDQAVQRSREAVALGEELGQPSTLALALHFAAVLRQYRREETAVQENAEATTAIATEHALSLWLAGGDVMRGWALAEHGAWFGGIAQVRKGLTAWEATGSTSQRTYFLALLAETLNRDGQIEEALGVLAEALVLMDGRGEAFHGAELHRLQGELLLRQEVTDGACHEAEACFHRALTIAKRQQAKSLELRAAMSLTRQYQKQHRQAEAWPILAACYDWFTEGFDTLDLQEAKALLEQVS
jgi:predicted ATPase